MIDFYATLGVKRTASVAQIERAYRKMKNRRRPAARNLKAQALYLETQLEIQSAWTVLADPQRRARYDSLLESAELALSIAEDFTFPVANPATGKSSKKVVMTQGQFLAVKALLKLRENMIRNAWISKSSPTLE